jgi:hypothetical protein
MVMHWLVTQLACHATGWSRAALNGLQFFLTDVVVVLLIVESCC